MTALSRILAVWAALLAAGRSQAQTLPQIYSKTPVQLLSSRTVGELPRNTFLENIAIAADGTAYINSHLDGRIYRMLPGKTLEEWAKVEGKIAGIAEREDGSFLVSGWTKDEKAALFLVQRGGAGSLLGLIPGGQFPNGVTRWKDDFFFLADSYRGVIYLVEGRTGKTRVWLDEESLRRADPKNPTPGVNGLKLFGGFLYASNTAKQKLLKIAIGDDGKPGALSVVSTPIALDDFAFDAEGNLYGSTHVYNRVVRLAQDGGTTVIADGRSGVTGCTAVAFGRTARDREQLYVVTNGGMSLPSPGGVETAKVVALGPDPASGVSDVSDVFEARAKRLEILPLVVEAAPNRIAAIKTGTGPAVVIVHGIGGHKEDWQGVMEALAADHTVYAIDMIGFGGSSKDAKEITVAMQSAAVLALLDAEKIDKASLIGNSVGGWVAATFAARNPERVRRLVLVDAAGFRAMFEGPSPVDFYPGSLEDMQKLLRYVFYSPERHTAKFAEEALLALNRSGDKGAGGVVFQGLFSSPRLEELMPSIAAPTLVVWGAEDKLFPPALADLVTGGIRGAQKTLVPEAGHFPQLDNPERFHQVIQEFLSR